LEGEGGISLENREKAHGQKGMAKAREFRRKCQKFKENVHQA
jgi:hypothetical protein